MDKGLVFFDVFLYVIFAGMMILVFFVLIKHLMPKPACLEYALTMSEVAMTNNVGHSSWGFAVYNKDKKRVEAGKIKLSNILAEVPFENVKYVRVEDFAGQILLETPKFNCHQGLYLLPRYGVIDTMGQIKPVKVVFGVCCPK